MVTVGLRSLTSDQRPPDRYAALFPIAQQYLVRVAILATKGTMDGVD